MTTTVLPSKIALQEKLAVLSTSRTTLKQEFVGIDAAIDQVLDSITPWYLFPHLQDRPTIINLWGLTGVGKSSLVKRLTELLSFEEQYFRFDLGETFDREYGIKKKLGSLFPEFNGVPMVIAFDEFQHARTLDAQGAELDKGFIRTIWEILDSGSFSLNLFNHYVQGSLSQLINSLKGTLANGVVVENGVVIEQREYFFSTFTERGSHISQFNRIMRVQPEMPETVYFVGDQFVNDIYSICLGKFKSSIELKDALDALDGPGTIKLLEDILKNSLAPQLVDCTKSVVFIMGNLDDAYSMSHNLNPDISADEFYRQSLRINLSDIKAALSKRFRQEQIARLGNCHIIYPTLNKAAFDWIIEREFTKLREKANSIGIALNFDASIKELIYAEGVFPTQGVRPLYTTIQQIVGTQLGKVMSQKIQLYHDERIEVNFSWTHPALNVTYRKGKKLVHQSAEKIILNLGKLREPTKDDTQAVTAVHEAGHAILSMKLLRILPQVVYSVSADKDSTGFVYSATEGQLISLKELPNRLATMLGGMAAEEVVFGRDYVTTGASSDLKSATHLVNYLILESGLGKTMASYQRASKAGLQHLIDGKEQREEAERFIQDAYALALDTLRAEKSWLLRLSDYLSDHAMASPKELKQIALLYGNEFNLKALVKSHRHAFYRNKLKECVSQDANIMALWNSEEDHSDNVSSHAA